MAAFDKLFEASDFSMCLRCRRLAYAFVVAAAASSICPDISVITTSPFRFPVNSVQFSKLFHGHAQQ